MLKQKYLTIMIVSVLYGTSNTCAAAPLVPAGLGEFSYEVIKTPGLASCTPYRDVLGAEFNYTKNDISGPIPYTRSYQTALSENINRKQEITDGLRSIGGWQDNFNNYLILKDEGVTKNNVFRVVMRLRFFNDTDETFYIGALGVDKKLSTISRILSPMPNYYEGRLAENGSSGRYKDEDRIGTHNQNHRDRGLVLNNTSKIFTSEASVNNLNGLSFTLNHGGNKYTFSHIKTYADLAIYRITMAELSSGQILKFKYDAVDSTLLKVVDQYGDFLLIERNQKDPDTDYAVTTYPTKVIAGKYASKSNSIDEYLNRTPTNDELDSSKVQVATYTYEAFDWKNYGINDRAEKIYALSSANSTNNKEEKYEYTKVSNVNFRDSLYSNPVQGDRYTIPSLKSVYQQVFQEQGTAPKSYIVEYDYRLSNFHLPFSTMEKNTRRISISGNGADYTPDTYNARNILNLYKIESDLYVKDDKTDPMYVTRTGRYDNDEMTVDFSGFPCSSYNGVPVSRAIYNVINNQLKSVVDRKGNITSFIYDDSGRLASTVEAENDVLLKRTTKYTYSPDSRLFQVPTKIEKKDEVVDNVLDDKGRVLQSTITNTNSGITKSKIIKKTYENDLLKSKTDPDGTIKTLDYEDIGVNPKKETITKNGLSAVTEFSNYNSAGVPGKVVAPNGIEKTTYFNSSNLPEKIVERDPITGLSNTSKYTYDGKNLLIEEQKPDANFTKYTYNPHGILQSVYKPDQFLRKTFTYNTNGQILTEKEQNFISQYNGNLEVGGTLKDIVTNVYDRSGRISEEKYGTNSTANWKRTEYDANGNVNKIIKPSVDATDSVESFNFDALNRIKDYTDPLGKIYTYQYDSFDNSTLKKASNGSNSTNSFISGKDLAKETNSDFGIKEYTYDDTSNLLTSKHAATRYCNFLSYDVLDNYKQSNCQNVNLTTSTKDVNYKFNYHQSRFSRLDAVESMNKTGFTGTRYWGGNTVYGYDGLDRVTSKEQRVGRLQTSDTKLLVNYKYTDGGRIQEITYPSGKKVTYLYDYFMMPDIWNGGEIIYGDPRLANISVGTQTILSLGYNDISLVSSLKWGNGNTTDYLYNSVKNITNITHKVANADYDSIVNTYYNNGLLQTKKIGSQTNTYMYDKKGQLLQEIVSGGYTHTFSYDENGNRKSFTSSGVNNPYPISSAAYTYATSGNKYATMMHNNVAQSFTYNSTGELNLPNVLGIAVYDYQGRREYEGPTPDNKFTEHQIEYNHKNQRILTARNGINRQYIYDEADHLLGEYDVNGVAIVEYVWMGDKPIAALYPNSTVYLLTDEKNTPYRGIDAANNAKVWVRNADAFGVAKPTTETVEMNLRFPGQIYDKATGLHYNLNRYYNPLLGRYMEADPIGLNGGWNPYTYVGNDPVNKIDSNGLMEFKNEPMKTVRGIESSYRFNFKPLPENVTETAATFAGIGKRLNNFQKFADFISPKPVGPKTSEYNPINIIEVGQLDRKLEIEYKAVLPKNAVGLNRGQAEKYLNKMFYLYPDAMKKHYDIPKVMLNKADENTRNSWFSINPPENQDR